MATNRKSIQVDNVNDKTLLLSKGENVSDLDDTNDNDDSFNILSTIDEVMENIKIGLFHYLIVIACGLSFSGYGIHYQSLGLIIITACDLNINAANKGWLSISFMIGMIPGAIIFGALADIYGRRRILLLALLINLTSKLASVFAFSYTMLAVITGLVGSSYGALCAIDNPYAIEFFPRRYRGIAGACVSGFVILGSVYGCAIALAILPHSFHVRVGSIYFTNWRLYLLMTMIPTLLGFCILLFMPNSLRFVLNNQNKRNILLVLDKIDRINSCYPCSYQLKTHQSTSIRSVSTNHGEIDFSTIETRRSEQSRSIQHIRKFFKEPWRKRLLLLSITYFGYCFSDKGFLIWLPTVLSFYVSGKTCWHNQHHAIHNLSLNITQGAVVNSLDCYSSDNIKAVIINLLIGNMLSIPLTISCILLINRVGRKLLYCIMASMCGFNLLLIYFIDSLQSTTILSCIFMSFTASGWIPVKTWSSELFCTEIRSTAMGLLNVVGYIGCILGMTTFILLFDTNCTATFMIFGSVALLAVAITLFLPDTTNADIE